MPLSPSIYRDTPNLHVGIRSPLNAEKIKVSLKKVLKARQEHGA